MKIHKSCRLLVHGTVLVLAVAMATAGQHIEQVSPLLHSNVKTEWECVRSHFSADLMSTACLEET